jgi:hypothetical protein
MWLVKHTIRKDPRAITREPPYAVGLRLRQQSLGCQAGDGPHPTVDGEPFAAGFESLPGFELSPFPPAVSEHHAFREVTRYAAVSKSNSLSPRTLPRRVRGLPTMRGHPGPTAPCDRAGSQRDHPCAASSSAARATSLPFTPVTTGPQRTTTDSTTTSPACIVACIRR